jgi:hypothetical protein
LEATVVIDDTVGEHVSPQRVVAERNAREPGAVMHGERADGRARDGKSFQRAADEFI